jgi:hypothetical protein
MIPRKPKTPQKPKRKTIQKVLFALEDFVSEYEAASLQEVLHLIPSDVAHESVFFKEDSYRGICAYASLDEGDKSFSDRMAAYRKKMKALNEWEQKYGEAHAHKEAEKKRKQKEARLKKIEREREKLLKELDE